MSTGTNTTGRPVDTTRRAEPTQADAVDDLARSVMAELRRENYTIESLIRKAQDRNMSLNELRDSLVRHKRELDHTSLELFNSSYERFFELSQTIANLAQPIQQVISPIQYYHGQLSDLCRGHELYLDEINKKLAALEETNKNKLLAKRLISLIHRAERIFHQIQSISWPDKSQPDETRKLSLDQPVNKDQLETTTITASGIRHQVRRDQLDRLAVELYYLNCEVDATQPTNDELISIKQSLEISVRNAMNNVKSLNAI